VKYVRLGVLGGEQILAQQVLDHHQEHLTVTILLESVIK
jgi:hypothetical protein